SLRRGHAWARPLALAATGAAVTAVTTYVVVLGGSAPYAFAGWSADPTSAAAGELQSAQAVCLARIQQAAQVVTQTGAKQGDAAALAGLAPVLSDVRGPFTATVFAGSSTARVLCLSAPGAVSLRWGMHGPVAPAPGQITVGQVGYAARDGQALTMAFGQTGTGVTGVTLNLDDGQHIATSTGSSMFVAWWPGQSGIASATVASADGTTTQPLGVPGPQSPPPGTAKG
ncbi:MAG TPA: hypothetical protein VKR22_09600, partial [Acidimicrobiales bacterium]|nr:hypothetical protein [Acidimicrobiales bacterium]